MQIRNNKLLTLQGLISNIEIHNYSECYRYCVSINQLKGKFINDPANGLLWINSGVEYTLKQFLLEFLKLNEKEAQILLLKYKIKELEFEIIDLPF